MDGLLNEIQKMFSFNILQLLSVIFEIWIISYVYNRFKNNNYPPGPKGLPIVGILPWIVFYKPYVYLTNIAKKYGPMIHFKIGRADIVFINDYEMSKSMSQHPSFQGRPNEGFLQKFTSGFGIVQAEGPLWKHQRRFMVHALKDSGMGKLQMEDKIHDELAKVIEVIETSQGAPMNLHSVLEKSTCNIICALAFNKQYKYDDPILLKRIHNLDQNLRLLETLQTFSAYWFLYPFLLLLARKVNANKGEFIVDAKVFINDHRESLDPTNPRDMIDLFLIEMDKNEANEIAEKEYQDTFSHDQLLYLIMDLFAAGTETSSTTIRWAILYMLYYPEIQQKVQKEIDDTLGQDRLPRIEDKSILPYTMATLLEVQRLACVAPASLARSNPNTAFFGGYTFEPRSIFHFNIYAIHRDERLWNKPEEFNPSRFIDDQYKVVRPPYLMPFGSGKRVCPGESLARVEVFLYFATLMQQFTFEAADRGRLPSLDSGTGFVRAPLSYEVKASRRSSDN